MTAFEHRKGKARGRGVSKKTPSASLFLILAALFVLSAGTTASAATHAADSFHSGSDRAITIANPIPAGSRDEPIVRIDFVAAANRAGITHGQIEDQNSAHPVSGDGRWTTLRFERREEPAARGMRVRADRWR